MAAAVKFGDNQTSCHINHDMINCGSLESAGMIFMLRGRRLHVCDSVYD
jgi:hypothetical protein